MKIAKREGDGEGKGEEMWKGQNVYAKQGEYNRKITLQPVRG